MNEVLDVQCENLCLLEGTLPDLCHDLEEFCGCTFCKLGTDLESRELLDRLRISNGVQGGCNVLREELPPV